MGQKPARCLGIVTPGGLAEKLLMDLGEPAKAETLPPPLEGPSDVERIAQIVLDGGWFADGSREGLRRRKQGNA